MADELTEDQRRQLYDDQKRKIIASVFSRRNAAGTLDETYVAHLKIWDGGGPGAKPRYILLSQSNTGAGYIHKSKLNQNETFSVGKTWVLADLKGISVTTPVLFTIHLQRNYQWESAHAADQAQFLSALVTLFRALTPGAADLQLEGFADPGSSSQGGRQKVRGDYMRSSSPNDAPSTFRRSLLGRAQTPSQSDRDVESSSRRRSRPPSPGPAPTGISSRPLSSSQPRPSTPPQAPASRLRRPSNGSSSRPTSSPPKEPRQPVPIPTAESFRVSINAAPPPRSRPESPSKPPPRKQSGRNTLAPPNESGGGNRRDPRARISYFDPGNQATVDRLLVGGLEEAEIEEENSQATMANVEEMIEGYEWASDDIIGKKTTGGAADVIEARLLDELMALEKANIYSFLEADDRIAVVLRYMDEAVAELDNMGSLISSYKIHLNAAGDDISHIQSQNMGLQVQTQNQRALLAELENLLQTVQVDKGVLVVLSQESLEKISSIQRLEEAASELYKALQAGRDTDMAATMERLEEYRTHNSQFCKRIFDYLSLRFAVQAKLLLGDTEGLSDGTDNKRSGKPRLLPHKDLEVYLGRYSGLMTYLKEMDEKVYGKLCAAYFSAASDLHGTQMRALLSTYASYVKKSDEESDLSLATSPVTSASKAAAGMRRAGTLIRSPIDGRGRDKDKSDGDMSAAEVLALLLEQMTTAVYAEDDFITDFLQINDAALTFADYMGLDNYFRRQASRSAGMSSSTMKLVRSAMDLIFGYLPAELKEWIDNALSKDSLQVFGILASIERFLTDAADRGHDFILGCLGKQHTRLKALFDRQINEQIQSVENTKLTSKKRNGVAPFIKSFPAYVARVEIQLIGADGLEIRSNVDAAYETLVQSMFDSLKQMAKMEGEGEDKGQLNYHVILIENMHHFTTEISQLEIGSVVSFLNIAESIYEENMSAYVKIVMRRPFAKIIDFFEGIERLLKTTAPTEIQANASYNKAALKKVLKEYGTKDLRKHIDTLYRRVDKHFEADRPLDEGPVTPGAVLLAAWKACEDELLRITEFFTKRITQCYPDSGIELEYTVSDVNSIFKTRLERKQY